MSNILAFVVGVIWMGSPLIGLFILHEDVPKRHLLTAAIIGLSGIFLIKSDDTLSTVLGGILVGAGLLFVISLLRSPLYKDRVFRIGSDFGKPSKPTVQEPESKGPPMMNILDPVIRQCH